MPQARTTDRTGALRAAEGALLLVIARRSLEAHLEARPRPSAEALFPDGRLPAPLQQQRGAFVTWKRSGQLRGCIGFIEPCAALWEDICELAVGAACRDRRFPPVTADEAPALRGSVSVLGIPRPLDPDEVEVGRHGLVVAREGRRGLLLPQVALEWGWSREELLAHTCRKARLPDDAWQDPATEVLGFEAQIFQEP